MFPVKKKKKEAALPRAAGRVCVCVGVPRVGLRPLTWKLPAPWGSEAGPEFAVSPGKPCFCILGRTAAGRKGKGMDSGGQLQGHKFQMRFYMLCDCGHVASLSLSLPICKISVLIGHQVVFLEVESGCSRWPCVCPVVKGENMGTVSSQVRTLSVHL